jgi:hypothetical protein
MPAELPHFKLLLLRLKAPVPPGAGLRGTLTSLRMRLAWKVLFWFALAVLQLWLEGVVQQFPFVDSLIIFLANWMVYYTAIGTATDILFAGPPPVSGDAEVAWFAARLPSSGVVLSLVLGAMAAALPIAIAIMFYSWVRQAFYLDVYPGMTTWMQWLNASALYILRIPQLVLFGLCLTLAVRRTSLVQVAPWLLAGTASLLAEAMGSGAMPYVDVIIRDPLHWPGSYSFYTLILGAASLCLYANWSLRRSCAQEVGGWQAFTTLLLWCGFPLLVATLIVGEGWSGAGLFPAEFKPFSVLHAFMATFIPDVSAFWFSSEGGGVSFYGWLFKPLLGWTLAGLAYLLSLTFWWVTAVQCLDAARNVQGCRRSNLLKRI